MDVEDDEVSNHFETARTATFSDAVLAIAITLLVLDLKPPELSAGQSLGAALVDQWPRYVALVSSFALIGLIWIHHHRLFRMLERADHTLLNLNLLLMLAVLIIPFPTALLAEYPYERVSAVLYTSVVASNALLFNVMWRHVCRRPGLLRPNVDQVVIRLVGLQYRVGAITYLVLVAISSFSVHASIGGNIVAAVYFALPLHVLKRRAPRIVLGR
jgi:uncharacterized membrane protein